MTEKLKDVWKYMLGGAAVLLLTVFTMLWNSEHDFVNKVEARVCDLEKGKADKEEVKEMKESLRRIEDKIDRIRR